VENIPISPLLVPNAIVFDELISASIGDRDVTHVIHPSPSSPSFTGHKLNEGGPDVEDAASIHKV